MKNIALLFSCLLFISNSFAQSIMPTDSNDVVRAQNFEFIGVGNIVLTSKAVLVPYGAEFTNGLLHFERSLGYPFQSFHMEYNYITENGTDTALVRFAFRDANDTLLGQIEIPVYENNDSVDVSISDPNFINAHKIEVFVFASGSPWIRRNSILTIGSMVASNQSSTINSNYQVFPNPASTTTLLTSLDGSNMNSIQVMNGNGIVVDEYGGINSNTFTLNIGAYLPGQYYILIYSQLGVSSISIIVI